MALPNGPAQLSVSFLTATTALLKWKAPTNGAAITGYEISYAEGAAPGSTWIPTDSTRTRHLVKELKRSTQYTFSVRGIGNNGNPGDASSPLVTRTPIASLHNTLIFKDCVNLLDDGARVSVHGNPAQIIPAIADNDFKTSSTVRDYDINIAVDGQPTRVDAIFVKGTGLEGHAAVPTGGVGSGYSNRIIPATVRNWEGSEVSTVVHGFQHDLYLLSPHFTATSVRLTFTGPDVRVYEIMLMEFLFEIDANSDFTQIDPDFTDRGAIIHDNKRGKLRRKKRYGAGRSRWIVDCVVKVVPGKTLIQSVDEVLYTMDENPNIGFAQEPSRHPGRIYPALFLRDTIPVRLRTDDKTGGEVMTIVVAEQ